MNGRKRQLHGEPILSYLLHINESRSKQRKARIASCQKPSEIVAGIVPQVDNIFKVSRLGASSLRLLPLRSFWSSFVVSLLRGCCLCSVLDPADFREDTNHSYQIFLWCHWFWSFPDVSRRLFGKLESFRRPVVNTNFVRPCASLGGKAPQRGGRNRVGYLDPHLLRMDDLENLFFIMDDLEYPHFRKPPYIYYIIYTHTHEVVNYFLTGMHIQAVYPCRCLNSFFCFARKGGNATSRGYQHLFLGISGNPYWTASWIYTNCRQRDTKK